MRINSILELLTLALLSSLVSCVFTDGSFHTKELLSLRLTMADNPSLRKEYVAAIDQGTSTIRLNVPTYVDPSHLVPRFEFDGIAVSGDSLGWESGKTFVDLSTTRTVQVKGLDDQERNYTLTVTRTPPDASTGFAVEAIDSSLYLSYNGTTYYGRNEQYWSHSTTADANHLVFTRYNDYGPWPNRTHLYLEYQTLAISVSAGTSNLISGSLYQGAFSEANWLDFTNPVVLTLTAEDLSTRTLTITLVDPL